MLRWRHEGIRYSLSLPYDYSPENMHHATLKVAEIKLDIMKGCFDPTLEKYKPPKPVKAKPIATPAIIKEAKPVFLNDLVHKFNHCYNRRLSRYLRFLERRFRLSDIPFTIYLQRLHYYLQSRFSG